MILQALVKYAFKSKQDKISTRISLERYSAFQDSYGNSEYADEIEKNLKKYLLPISHEDLIREIGLLKQLDKQEQRQALYQRFSVLIREALAFQGEVSAGAIELLLEKLPGIEEEKIHFDEIKKANVQYPRDIDINLHVDNIHKQTNRSSQGSAYLLTHFKPQAVNQNSLVISELNLSVIDFNKKYSGRYTIKENKGICYKGIWFAYDKNNRECGNFLPQNGELMETQYSKGNYKFIKSIQEMDLFDDLSNRSAPTP